MAWARLDDGFSDHPKVLNLIDTLPEMEGAAAIGLWTLALSYAHRTMRSAKTPGLIPRSFPRRNLVPTWLGDRLVAAGLWEEHEDGWLIHDFGDYLPSDELRSKRAEAGKRGAAARWANGANASSETAGSDGNLPSGAMAKGDGTASMANGKTCPEPEPEPEPKKTSSSSSPAAPDQFDELWQIYPRRVGKDKARKAFTVAVKHGADPNAILAAARSYAERCRLMQQDPKYIPHPTTWLNRGSWDDDLEAAMPAPVLTGANGYQPYRNPIDQSGYDGAIR